MARAGGGTDATARATGLRHAVAGALVGGTDIVVSTYKSWRDDRCIRLGAGLAYYGLFAVVPVLLIAVVLADLVFQAADVQAFLAEPLARLLGADADVVAAQLADRVDEWRLAARLGPLGIVSTILAASLVFVAFQDALNAIWAVPYEVGIRRSVVRRLLAFGVVLVTGGILVTTLAVQAVVGVLGGLWPFDQPLVARLTAVLDSLAPVAATGVALAVLFVALPRRRVDRRAAAIAGGLTAALMALGGVAVGWYLNRFGGGSPQQAAGAVLVVLTGLYVQCQIVLAGVELSKVLTERWQGVSVHDIPQTG